MALSPARSPGVGATCLLGRAGTVVLRLAYRSPIQPARLFGFLAARAVPGVEEGDLGHYRRTLSLPNGSGVAEVSSGSGAPGYLHCVLALDDVRDLTAAVGRLRRLLDLDADPVAVVQALGSDPVLGPSVTAMPVSGHQAMSTAVSLHCAQYSANRSALRALVRSQSPCRRAWAKLARHVRSLTCLFPSAAAIAALSPKQLPMPASRRELFSARVRPRVRRGVLDAGADRTPSPSGWPP